MILPGLRCLKAWHLHQIGHPIEDWYMKQNWHCECAVIGHIISHHMISHMVTWCHVASHDVTWHHMMSHGHMASHDLIWSHGITWCHGITWSHRSHDVMWPHSNPFHCISPGKSQSISLRQQRTPSHWNTEIDDYASWNQHSEKDKHTRTRDRGEVSTPGCSLILRLFSFYKRSLGMRIRVTRGREYAHNLLCHIQLFPPGPPRKSSLAPNLLGSQH